MVRLVHPLVVRVVLVLGAMSWLIGCKDTSQRASAAVAQSNRRPGVEAEAGEPREQRPRRLRTMTPFAHVQESSTHSDPDDGETDGTESARARSELARLMSWPPTNMLVIFESEEMRRGYDRATLEEAVRVGGEYIAERTAILQAMYEAFLDPNQAKTYDPSAHMRALEGLEQDFEERAVHISPLASMNHILRTSILKLPSFISTQATDSFEAAVSDSSETQPQRKASK